MNRSGVRPAVLRGVCGLLLAACAGCGSTIHDEVLRAHLDNVRHMLDTDPALLEARNPLGKTPLHMAVTSGSAEMVDLLLERGADVNAQDDTGLTPLHVAAWWSVRARAKQLIDAGADIGRPDLFGDTPLHIAAMQGRLAMVDYLVQRGAAVDARNAAGHTALQAARVQRQEEAAALLEKLGAS